MRVFQQGSILPRLWGALPLFAWLCDAPLHEALVRSSEPQCRVWRALESAAANTSDGDGTVVEAAGEMSELLASHVLAVEKQFFHVAIVGRLAL